MAEPDMKVLVGIDGGPNLNGKSGKQILKDLLQISESISKTKAIKIKVGADTAGTSNKIASQLSSITPNIKVDPVKNLIQQYKELESALKSTGGTGESVLSKLNSKLENVGAIDLSSGIKGQFLKLLPTEDAQKQIEGFAKYTDLGAEALQGFFTSINDKGMKDYLASVDAGKASLEGYFKYVDQTNGALKATSPSAKAAATGMKLLSSLGGSLLESGIELAINLIIQVITNLILADQRAIDKANELSKAYEETTAKMESTLKQMPQLIQDYKLLSDGVSKSGENISLSAEDYSKYNDTVKELIKINPDLVLGYNEQGQAILDRNKVLEDAIGLEEQKIKLENRRYLNEDASDIVKGRKTELKQANENIANENFIIPVQIDSNRAADDVFKDVLKNAGLEQTFELDFDNMAWKSNANITDNLDLLKEMFSKREAIVAQARETAEYDADDIMALEDSLDYLGIYLEDAKQATAAIKNILKLQASSEGWNSLIPVAYLDDFDVAVTKIASDSNLSFETMAQKQRELGESFSQIQDQIPTTEIISLNEQLRAGEMDNDTYKQKLAEQITILDELAIQYPELAEVMASIAQKWRESSNFGIDTSSINNAYESFSKLRSEYEEGKKGSEEYVTALKSQQDSLNELIQRNPKLADSYKMIGSWIRQEINTAASTLDKLKTSTDSVISSAMGLSAAFAEQEEDGKLSAETILSVVDAGYAAALSIDQETGAVTLNASKYEMMTKAKIKDQLASIELSKIDLSHKMKLEGEQIENLTKGNAYLAMAYNSVAIAKLQSDYTENQEQLKELEAESAALNELLNNIGKVTTGNSKAAQAQSQENKALKEHLDLLEHRKSIGYYDGKDLQYIDDLQYAYDELCQKQEEYWDIEEKIHNARKQALDNIKQKLEEQKSAYEEAAEVVMNTLDHDLDSLNKRKDAIQKNIDTLNEEKNAWETAAGVAMRVLDKEIEALRTKYDEEKRLLENKQSKYDQAHSAILSQLDDQIKKYKEQQNAVKDAYQSQIDAIQEQIDLQREKNDESQREIDIEKAKVALEAAKTQKTQRVYREGQGWVWESDTNAIRDAQQNLDRLLKEKNIADLEKQIKDLEEKRDTETGTFDNQIKGIEDYKAKWDEIAATFEKQQNYDIASKLLGEGWDQKVVDQNLQLFDSFKNDYLSIQQKLADITTEQEAANARAEILEGYKQQWQDELDSYQIMQEQKLADDLFYAGWEQDLLNGRSAAFSIFKDGYLVIQDQILDQTAKIEAFEAEAQRLEAMKQQWQDYLDEQTRIADEEKANDILGINWKEDLYTNHEGLLNKFKLNYEKIQDAISRIDANAKNSTKNLGDTVRDAANAYMELANNLSFYYDTKQALQSGGSGSGTFMGNYLSEYASGTRYARAGVAITDELGPEAKFRKLENGKYTLLGEGDQVFTHSQTAFLDAISKNPAFNMYDFVDPLWSTAANPSQVNSTASVNITLGDLNFPNIKDPNQAKDFVRIVRQEINLQASEWAMELKRRTYSKRSI